MARLEDQVAQYFGALDRRADASGGPGSVEPPYPLIGSHGGGSSSYRRLSLVAALVAIIAVIGGTLAYVASNDSTPAADNVPDGWQAVTFGPVEFAVPDDWPVYAENRCIDVSANGAYVAGVTKGLCDGKFANGGIAVVLAVVPGGDPTLPERDFHGLRAFASAPQEPEGEAIFYATFPEEGVWFEMLVSEAADYAVALEIFESIRPASRPEPLPSVSPEEPQPTPETTATTVMSDEVAAYCSAVEGAREAKLNDPDTGAYLPGALERLREIQSLTPDNLRPPFDTLVAWLEAGAREPKPDEVGRAELQMTRDWAGTCHTLGSANEPLPPSAGQ